MTEAARPRDPIALPAATAVAIAAGLLTTWLGYGAFELQVAAWSLVAAVGIALLALLVHLRAPKEAAAVLLVLTSVAWSLGVAVRGVGPPGVVAIDVLWVATVVHALDLPAGPRTDPLVAGLVIAGYAAAFVPGPLAPAFIVATGILAFERRPGATPWRLARIGGLTVLAVGLIVLPAVADAVVGAGKVDLRPVTAATALAASVTVVIGALGAADRPAAMVDRFVEGAADLPPLREGETSDDLEIRGAVARASALTSANTMLQAELGEQVAEVEASRRRLIDAGDVERAALVARLEAGLQARLDELERQVRELDGHGGSTGDDASPMAATVAEIAGARADIRAIAEGLQPMALDGRSFASALDELVRRSPFPVDVRLEPANEPPPALRAVIWYVVSESLTNIAKHAHASRARVELVEEGSLLRLTVADDGAGGARPDAGRGLTGLRDRVDAAGGTLSVEAPDDGGTRVTAILPSSAGRHAIGLDDAAMDPVEDVSRPGPR